MHCRRARGGALLLDCGASSLVAMRRNILFDALPTNGRALLLPDRPRSENSGAES